MRFVRVLQEQKGCCNIRAFKHIYVSESKLQLTQIKKDTGAFSSLAMDRPTDSKNTKSELSECKNPSLASEKVKLILMGLSNKSLKYLRVSK